MAAADMLDHYAHGEGQYSGLPGGALHDPMAVATLIDPTIVTTTPLHVRGRDGPDGDRTTA